MNKKDLKKYQIFCVIFTYILGTLLHYTYDWSNQNSIVGLFSAVNESTWEHLKLVFFPMLITIIIGNFYFKQKPNNFICSKTIGILVAMAFTVVFFYTYTGVIGKNIDIINIISFYIAVLLGEIVSYLLMINNFKCNKNIAIIVWVILAILFFVFTFNPPKIGLFESPIKFINDSY